MKPEFSVSLMCMDFLDIKHQIEVLDQKADGYHIDIMDGHYCKNITLSPDFMRACARVAKKPMDVHLMTTNPNDWIDACAQAGAALISPHAETINTDCFRTLNHIRDAAARWASPSTRGDPALLLQALPQPHRRAHADDGGRGLRGAAVHHRDARQDRRGQAPAEENGWHYRIMIDGSCNKKTFKRLYDAGAETFILAPRGSSAWTRTSRPHMTR